MFKQLKKSNTALALAGVIALIGGAPAAHASVTTYNVTQSYNQVVYDVSHPTWDTVFTGSFSYDNSTNTVSNLMGSLSQAMTGNANFVSLSNQLSSVYDATLGGFLVSSFHQNTTDVFSNSGNVAGVTGFATGGTKQITSGTGNQNAYVTIFFNPINAFASLTSPQIDKLAYGDCTTGSLMGMGTGAKTCMTGWVNHAKTNLAGGTMQGTYPISQTITAAVPEPETYAMLLAGLGLMGAIARRRRTA
jgi:hypothetical protein